MRWSATRIEKHLRYRQRQNDARARHRIERAPAEPAIEKPRKMPAVRHSKPAFVITVKAGDETAVLKLFRTPFPQHFLLNGRLTTATKIGAGVRMALIHFSGPKLAATQPHDAESRRQRSPHRDQQPGTPLAPPDDAPRRR